MRQIRVEKVTVNMGVGQSGEELRKAQQIIERITGSKAVQTKCRVKQPKWEIRPGLPIGLKVVLRNDKAIGFLKRALEAKDNSLSARSFDLHGNFGFGIREYIDIPGAQYDPALGIRGLDVLVTLERPGYRVKKRKMRRAKVGKRHSVRKEEAIGFVKEQFGVDVK
jgi:large subunit ribosomal protein L5